MASQPYTVALAEWAFSQDWFSKEQELAWHELFPRDIFGDQQNPPDETLQIFLNQWIIYDRPTATHGRTPLSLFIDAKVKHQLVERSIYEGFTRSWLGIFVIEAVQSLQSLTLFDLASGRRFEVEERRGTIGSEAGDLMYARIMPLGQEFFIGAGYGLIPSEEAKPIRYTWDRLRRNGPVPPMTAQELAPLLLPPTPMMDRWRMVVALDEFLKSKNYAARSAAEVVNEFKRLDSPDGIIHDLLTEVQIDTPNEANKLAQLLVDLWNGLRAKKPKHGEAGAGPIESALVHDMLQVLQTAQASVNLSTAEDAKRFGEEQRQRYLHTPQPELQGKTPWQVILSERQERGNPDTGFHYHLTAQPVPSPELARFQKLFNDALKSFKAKKFKQALRGYKKILAYGDDRVPEIWRIYGNAGVCAIELDEWDMAEEYFRKALKLNPHYELAQKNLQQVKSFRNTMRGYRKK